MNAQEMMKMDKADLVWRILTLESKVEAQDILIRALEGDIEKNKPSFDPKEVTVGSVWECVKVTSPHYIFRDCSFGKTYKITSITNGELGVTVNFEDDVKDNINVSRSTFLKYFKRIS